MNAEPRTIAVGDVHGCCKALDALLAALSPGAEDVLVILGDAIDRGPCSRQVIERLLDLREHCQLIPILGNHEQMLLDAIDGQAPLQTWLMHGGAETFDSYDVATLRQLPDEHVDFLRSWGDYYELPSHFFAHANYLPKLPLEDQPWETLRWESLKFRTPAMHCSGKTAVVGHTSNKQGEIVNLGHLVCVDTYCHGGKWLTALEPTTGQLWQANESGDVSESQLAPPVRG